MPLCSELMSRPKKAAAGSRPERTTPGGSSRAGRGRQYCKLRWLLSPKPEFSKCIFELKMPRPVIEQRVTSTNSCHEPPLVVELSKTGDPRPDTATLHGGLSRSSSLPHYLAPSPRLEVHRPGDGRTAQHKREMPPGLADQLRHGGVVCFCVSASSSSVGF